MALNFNNISEVNKMFNQAEAIAETLPREAYNEFRANTPVRSGNAFRKTTLRGSTIEANYPYAERLDDGYSPLKPQGMTEPTEKFLEKRVNDLIRKIK
jgi:hypothetical protein